MKNHSQQALTLLEALDQVNEAMLQQAFATDTAEKFHALGKVKKIQQTKERPAHSLPRWLGVAACLALVLALAASPWVFSTLLPVFIQTMPTEPPEPPTTGFTDVYDNAEPPKLLLYGNGASIWPVMTGYDWTYYPEPGNTVHDVVEAPNPLSADMKDTIPWLTTEESTLVLKFQTDPSSIIVRCWEAGSAGNPDAYDTYDIASCVNQSLQLKPGSYLYEVTAEWYPLDNRHGSATYVFGVNADFALFGPDRNIQIVSGDRVLQTPAEVLNQGSRYDEAAKQWISEFGGGGYWTLHDAATNGTKLPCLLWDGDFRVELGANGTLTDIRVYFAREGSNPGVYQFAKAPEEVSDLPAGQWYILLCVTWEGRFIEHENACETYDYEYVFTLEVAEAETPPFLWDFDKTSGILTVSGCESIPDFTYEDQWTTPPWAEHREEILHITIADGVKRIGNMAFRDMPNLESIVLPYGLKEIGDYAFYKAEKLKYASLPANLETIGDYAFAECLELPDFHIPAALKHIGQGAFQFCKLPTSLILPSQLSSVGNGAFQHCTGLQEVTILGSPEALRYTFQGCTALQIIRFCGNAPASLGDITFEDRVICYYPSHNSTWTDEILDTANLYYTAWFASYDPASEKLPGETTSGQCGRTAYWELKDGTLTISGTGDVTYLGWENFRSDIRKVIIEDGITNIPNSAFYQCGNLTSVTIPQSVTFIGSNAFNQCKKLGAVTLPENLEFMGGYAFEHCEALEEIVFPEGMTEIPNGAFLGCKSLKSITWPSNLTLVGQAAFQNCTSLKELHFPATLQSLGDYAFSKCSSLKKLYFYGDAPGVSNFTFEGVTATAYYPPGNVSWISGGMKFHSGNISEKPDPNQENQGCITHDFGDWVILKEPTRLEGGKQERVCKACGYKETEGLPPIVWEGEQPAHPELGEPIASGKNHNVKWNLYTDGTLAVFGVRIMEGSNKHRYAWHDYADQITRIIVEEGLANIAPYAFQELPNLVSVRLPDTLMRIENEAFFNCPKLKSLVIPASVVDIQDYAFSRCASLHTVYFLGNAPKMEDHIFNHNTLTAYYPADNATWTEDHLRSYGGTVTWVAGDPGSFGVLHYRKEEAYEA